MKRKLRIPALAVLAIAVLLSFGLSASALMPPINVPADYDTITEALAHAVAGSTILVAAGYDSEDDDEKFPITVTLDNITIVGASGAIIRVPASHAGVVFKGVTGGKLEGFLITSVKDADPQEDPPDTELGDIGVVVKESTNVLVKGNTIYNLLEGIRLINASYNTIESNTLHNIGEDTDPLTPVVRSGIGIFLEVSTSNTLRNNEVYNSGEGLFVFESHYNDVIGDSYHDNTFMGVDLNDSSRNGLDGLSVKDNGTWGIYLMFSAENTVENCEVSGNDMGGIELAASSLNYVLDNYIHDNGTGTKDNIQVVVADGDKVLFTAPDVFNPEEPIGEIAKIKAKKDMVEWKVGFFEGWIVDLDRELEEITQKVDIAAGMCDLQTHSDTIIDVIETAIDEKHCIIQTDSYTIDNLDDVSHRAGFFTWLTDPTKNFSIEGAGEYFDDQIDSLWIVEDNTLTGAEAEAIARIDLGCDWWVVTSDYDGNTTYPFTKMVEFYWRADALGFINLDCDDLETLAKAEETEDLDFPLLTGKSLTKEAILRVIIASINWEIDEIKREIGLVPDVVLDSDDKAEILGKLNAVKGYLDEIYEDESTGILAVVLKKLEDKDEGGKDDVDEYLQAAIVHLNVPNYTLAKADLDEARGTTPTTGLLRGAIYVKQDIYYWIGWIEKKLDEVNKELPPDVEFNGTIIGKKEQAKAIDDGVAKTDTGDKATGHILTVANALVIALNLDTTAQDIREATVGGANPRTFVKPDITFEHVGLTASTGNLIAGNVITTNVVTNELNIGIKLESPDNDVVNNLITNEDIINGRAGFYGTMDRGIIMLSSHNNVVYNAIEYVDIGIVRGGSETRDDVQQEYLFKKLAKVECYKPQTTCACTRPIQIVAVMEKANEPITVTITERTVKWNRIALNLFEHLGYGIQIVDAESNQIDENMFIENTDGGIYFESGVGPHIIIEHNDFVGGISVANEGTTDRDASENYAYDSPVSGPVTPPDATTPFCTANFGTDAKFEALGFEEFFNEDYPTLPPMAQSSNLRRLVVAGVTFTLPAAKPRTCADVFGGTQPTPGEDCCQFYEGWNLTSLPVEPVNPDPEVVYDEVTGTLYLYEYVPETGTWNTVENGLLTEVSSMGAYYLWLAEDTLVCVDGEALDSPQSLALGDAGWYTFGVPYEVDWDDGGQIMVTRGATTYDLADAVAAGWIWNQVYEYDAVAQDWIVTSVASGTTLQVCKGYWFYTYVDDLLFGIWETPQQGPPGPPPVPSTKSLNTLKAPGTPPMPGEPVSFSADGLEFTNYPNPVRDVHTTTFAVKGAMAVFVEAIKVQIFDLSGRMVYEEEMAGKSFDWHTDNDYGELLANGVYLYKLYALVEGKWVVSDVRKLAILR